MSEHVTRLVPLAHGVLGIVGGVAWVWWTNSHWVAWIGGGLFLYGVWSLRAVFWSQDRLDRFTNGDGEDS